MLNFYRQHLKNIRPSTNGWHDATCPFHDDSSPSFSFEQGGNWLCRAGCGKGTVREFAQRLNVTPPTNGKQPKNGTRGRISKTYDYVDEHGQLAYQVCRFEPKGFRQRQPDGAGGWKWNLRGVEPLPYNLPALLKADIVYIVEGEKDVLNLEKIGLIATCNSGGAGKWQADFARYFKGKHCIILPDNDEPGRKHGNDVAAKLRCMAASIKIVNLPGLPEKGDVSDWLAAGGSVEQLQARVDAAPRVEITTEPQPQQQVTTEKKTTHVDVAELAVQKIGKESLVFALESFWKYGAGLWQKIDDREIKQTIVECLGPKETTSPLVSSICELLKTILYQQNHEFDCEKRAINCINGELFWTDEKWELRPHRRESYRTTQIPVIYDPLATAPRFIQAMQEWFFGDDDAKGKMLLLCQALGYAILSNCDYEKFFLLIGNGANGKSVFLDLLRALVGAPNACAVQPSQLDNRFQRAHLLGRLVNIVTEIAEGAVINDAALKAIVSGELTTAEHKHQNPFDFSPFATCFFAANHMPHTSDFSDALFRRAIVITFNRKFEESQQDRHLKEKLVTELPGVLNLALGGIAEVFKKGCFHLPESSKRAAEMWRSECDQAVQFVDDRCEMAMGAKVSSGELYSAYKSWVEDMGIRKPLGQRSLTVRLTRLGIESGKGTAGARLLYGIKLCAA